jgi:hypothetical protein
MSETAPKGWPAALVMFHVGMWRERMRDALVAAVEGRDYALPGTRDDINDRELAAGIGTPLSAASARADHLLNEIVSLFQKVGDRPVQWFAPVSGGDAVLRNSYTHPRSHICEYLAVNGDVAQARKLLDDALDELGSLSAPEYVTQVLAGLKEDPRFKEPTQS